jgi:sarcosine oxidase subunit delta
MRDQVEFRYGGEAGVERPVDPQASSDSEWAGYLYLRDNRKGLQRERWVHIHGCRQWFELWRDTATHAWHDVAGTGDGTGTSSEASSETGTST